MEHLTTFFRGPGEPSTPLVMATSAFATVAFLAVAKRTLWPAEPRVLPNPLKTIIPRMTEDEVAALAYRPDQFPGARDVDTPVGLTWRELRLGS